MRPTLDELLKRLKGNYPYRDSAKEMYRRVAAGERDPLDPPLPANVVKFACQAVYILFAHVDNDDRYTNENW